MRAIVLSTQFRKDLKLARRRNLPIEKLNEIVFMLANDMELPMNNHDHALTGNKTGFRECHIQPDWLLIYNKVEGEVQILNLYRTGSHSDLF